MCSKSFLEKCVNPFSWPGFCVAQRPASSPCDLDPGAKVPKLLFVHQQRGRKCRISWSHYEDAVILKGSAGRPLVRREGGGPEGAGPLGVFLT